MMRETLLWLDWELRYVMLQQASAAGCLLAVGTCCLAVVVHCLAVQTHCLAVEMHRLAVVEQEGALHSQRTVVFAAPLEQVWGLTWTGGVCLCQAEAVLLALLPQAQVLPEAPPMTCGLW